MAERDELIEQAARELAAWNNRHPYAVRFKMYNVVDDYPDRDPYVVIVEKVAELLGWTPPPQKPVGYVVDGKVYVRLRAARHRAGRRSQGAQA